MFLFLCVEIHLFDLMFILNHIPMPQIKNGKNQVFQSLSILDVLAPSWRLD